MNDPEPVVRIYSDTWVNSQEYADMLRIECERRSQVLLVREAEERKRNMTRTFNLDRTEDRNAYDAEARELAKTKGISRIEAYRLLADRIEKPPARTVDSSDPTTRVALVHEAKRRIELSRVDSITRLGNESETTPFDVALNSVVSDIVTGQKEIPGVTAEVKP